MSNITKHLQEYFKKRNEIKANISKLSQAMDDYGDDYDDYPEEIPTKKPDLTGKVRLHYEFVYFDIPTKKLTNSIVFNSKMEALAWIEDCKYNANNYKFQIIHYFLTEA